MQRVRWKLFTLIAATGALAMASGPARGETGDCPQFIRGSTWSCVRYIYIKDDMGCVHCAYNCVPQGKHFPIVNNCDPL